MILKLSLSNVKKSINDYLVYFLTLTFSVCLFYTFNSFQSQSAIMELNSSQSSLLMTIGILMQVLSVFVAMVLAFLILYANNFLIKRRKKEFGLYLIMGMPKNMISKILICETFFVGLTSLITGLFLGVIVSQFFSILTAQLFQAAYQYHFVFSLSTMMITSAAFSFIFFIVMLFNSRVLTKFKVIDLLNANAKNEKVKIKHVKVSIILFVISIILLGVAYSCALDVMKFYGLFLPIIAMGILGTLLFFMSLSGFFIEFIKRSRNLYFQGLNAFILKQVNAKINTNYVSMSVICLLLLLSIGAFATGFNLSNAFATSLENKTPYDLTINRIEGQSLNEVLSDEELKYITYADEMKTYSATLGEGEFLDEIADKIPLLDQTVEIISLSDYNQLLRHLGMDELHLQENQVQVLKGNDFGAGLFDDGVTSTVQIDGQTMEVLGVQTDRSIQTEHQEHFVFALIAPDQWIQKEHLEIESFAYNIETINDAATQALLTSIDSRIRFISRSEVIENGMSLGIVFSYIGLYLGFVFLMASAVILALQQLSQVNDNKKQYQCLQDIGADQKMIQTALLKQIAIYFGVPLILAVVHSYVGIQAVMGGFHVMFGFSDLWSSSLMTSVIFLLIYGVYFLITYFGCRKIITQS